MSRNSTDGDGAIERPPRRLDYPARTGIGPVLESNRTGFIAKLEALLARLIGDVLGRERLPG